MEKLYIVLGCSVVIPLVTIVALMLIKQKLTSKHIAHEREKAEQNELIGVMEDIIETKSNTINLLK